MENNKRDATIDILRIVASILVISIHTTSSMIAMTIGRWAVPFFMVVTGYFYFNNPNHDKLIKIVKNLLSLWLIWMIIYIPNAIIHIQGMSISKAIHALVWAIIGDSIFFDGSWYLPAAAFGIWVTDYFRKHCKMVVCNILALVLLFVGCVASSYDNLNLGILSKMHWATTFPMGVIWMTLAFYISKYQKQLKTKLKWSGWIILAMLLTIFEHIFTLKFGFCSLVNRSDMYFTLPISILILFAFIFNHPHYQSKEKTLWFRNFATLLFFTQFYVITFVKAFVHIKLSILKFIIVLVVSSAISLIILWISNKKHFSILKKIYE